MQSNRNDKIEHAVCTQFFSWTPIFVGGFVALGLGFLLDLFAKSIGLTLYTNDVNGATTLAVGGFIALIIGSIATMFTAGFTAGCFAAPTCGKRNFGVVYGFVAWCLGLLLMAIFAGSIAHSMDNRYKNYSNATTQEMMQTTQNVATKMHPATDRFDTQAEKNIRATGLVSLAFFILFFVGALSASLGGYCGFCCWEKKEMRDRY